ncbi:MAG TPA: hypothetical protein VF755_15715, partial [Catenuloplanes sp.]
SRVLVSARKLADLGVSGDPLEAPAQLEVAPRQPQAPELVDHPPHLIHHPPVTAPPTEDLPRPR